MEGLSAYKDVIKSILESRTESTEEFNKRLRDFTEFFTYYQEESIKLIKNWKKK